MSPRAPYRLQFRRTRRPHPTADARAIRQLIETFSKRRDNGFEFRHVVDCEEEIELVIAEFVYSAEVEILIKSDAEDVIELFKEMDIFYYFSHQLIH